jgi:RNA polymerase sigma-70 factor, ECF subfamily
MPATTKAIGDAAADRATTLGDILYATTATPASVESEWAAVVRCIAAGDQRALHELYDRTHRLVFTLALRITCDRNTAEEVTLDVFHDVWRRAAGYDPTNGSVVGWIMNQARSRAIDRLRFELRVKRVSPDAESPLPVAVARGPAEMLELAQLRDVVRDALGVLTGDERQAIETAYFSGLTHVEAAQRLKLPLGTVKTRIRSGLAKLRKVLSEDPKR